jgi:hypothetical protein
LVFSGYNERATLDTLFPPRRPTRREGICRTPHEKTKEASATRGGPHSLDGALLVVAYFVYVTVRLLLFAGE